jgi:acetyltransferase-like isoleucine patch superfamily enzyme
MGKNAHIWSGAKIIYPENVTVGDESVIDDFAFLLASGKGIKIGKFCHITAHCTLNSGGLIEIGDFSAIAWGGVIIATTDDYNGGGFIGLKVLNKYRNTVYKDVKIGRHVHIGARSVIMPGVELGDGCSIGAGSVVTRSMPEWAVCYGSPCSVKKTKSRDKQLQMEEEFLKEYYGGKKWE